MHTVADADPNVILAHLATEMCKHLVASVEFNREKRIWKGFLDDPVHNDLRIVNPTLPTTRLGLHHPYASLQPARLGAGLSLTCHSITWVRFGMHSDQLMNGTPLRWCSSRL